MSPVLSSKDDTVMDPDALAVPVARNQPLPVLSLLVRNMLTFHVPVRSAWVNAAAGAVGVADRSFDAALSPPAPTAVTMKK